MYVKVRRNAYIYVYVCVYICRYACIYACLKTYERCSLVYGGGNRKGCLHNVRKTYVQPSHDFCIIHRFGEQNIRASVRIYRGAYACVVCVFVYIMYVRRVHVCMYNTCVCMHGRFNLLRHVLLDIATVSVCVTYTYVHTCMHKIHAHSRTSADHLAPLRVSGVSCTAAQIHTYTYTHTHIHTYIHGRTSDTPYHSPSLRTVWDPTKFTYTHTYTHTYRTAL